MIDTSDGLPVGEVTFCGVPFPEDRSMFGWVHDGTVTAIVCCYTEPKPLISVMPRADVPEAGWPPITSCDFGGWFWDAYRAGDIVDLAPLVAEADDGAIFWVDTTEAIGSGCIAVACDLDSPAGWTLPRGRYVYHQHRDGIPSLDDLLADPGKTDLAPRFRES